MKRIFWLWMISVAVVACLLSVMIIRSFAQAPAPAAPTPPKYEFTELQKLKLQNAQKDTVISYQNLQAVQQDYFGKLKLFNDMADQYRKENKWPEGLSWDGQTLQFTDPAPKAAAPAK